MRKLSGIVLLLLALSCARRTAAPAAEAPSGKLWSSFPLCEVPALLTEPSARMEYATLHYWERFLGESDAYLTDSLHVAGLSEEGFESAIGTYVTLLEMLPLPQAQDQLGLLYQQIEASPLFPRFTAQLARYLYDPNSPVRSEDLWLPYVSLLAQRSDLRAAEQHSYAFEAEMCARNRIGSPATDFAFTDSAGQLRTLYGIQAEYTLLVFGNPGCRACQDLLDGMAQDERIDEMVRSGRLKVADIYIDDEFDEWKAHVADYPPQWINGFDHQYTLRRDLVYHVRALPSIYLLDRDKTVLLKDVPPDRLFPVLSQL